MNNFMKSIFTLGLISTLGIHAGTATVNSTTKVVKDAGGSTQELVESCRTMIKNLGQDAISKLKGSQSNRKDREKQFQPIFLKNFDSRKIGKFVLGSYYRKVTHDEFEAFLKVFQRTIVSIYANRLGNYNDEKFIVKDGRVTLNNPAEKMVVVKSQVVSAKGNTININWTIAVDKGQKGIVDVSVENVSQAMTQREDFMETLRAGGIQGLMRKLEAKYAENIQKA